MRGFHLVLVLLTPSTWALNLVADVPHPRQPIASGWECDEGGENKSEVELDCLANWDCVLGLERVPSFVEHQFCKALENRIFLAMKTEHHCVGAPPGTSWMAVVAFPPASNAAVPPAWSDFAVKDSALKPV